LLEDVVAEKAAGRNSMIAESAIAVIPSIFFMILA
jgi:hypothetical protein